jgi:hypothetical protein
VFSEMARPQRARCCALGRDYFAQPNAAILTRLDGFMEGVLGRAPGTDELAAVLGYVREVIQYERDREILALRGSGVIAR